MGLQGPLVAVKVRQGSPDTCHMWYGQRQARSDLSSFWQLRRVETLTLGHLQTFLPHWWNLCPPSGTVPRQQWVTKPVALGTALKRHLWSQSELGWSPAVPTPACAQLTQPLLHHISTPRSVIKLMRSSSIGRSQRHNKGVAGEGGSGGMLLVSHCPTPRSRRGFSVLEVNAGKQLPPFPPPPLSSLSSSSQKKSCDSLI